MALFGLVFSCLFVGVLVHGLFFFPSRALAARAMGVGGFRVALGIDHAPWRDAPVARRTAFAVAGPLGCYLVAAGLVALGVSSSGTETVDETTMRVEVVSDSPAATAGFEDGDRIVAIEGTTIESWPQLQQTIGARPGERIDVAIERNGMPLVLSPNSTISGKIGIRAPSVHREVSPGQAAREGLVQAPKSWLATASALVGPSSPVELAGPVAVIRQASPAHRLARSMVVFGSLLSFYLFVPILIALALFPRRSGALRPPSPR